MVREVEVYLEVCGRERRQCKPGSRTRIKSGSKRGRQGVRAPHPLFLTYDQVNKNHE